MAIRKATLRKSPPRPELDRLIAESKVAGITDAELKEQRVSFAYGNAPEDSSITKDSARRASESFRLLTRT